MDFSVIIPQRNSVATLPRLFNSIPQSDKIEIILVDNTPEPITKEIIGIDRDYKLLWSHPDRHAGGARNVGLEAASGKWLIFADADDYFTPDAFEIFYSQFNSEAEVLYFGMTGIYPETGEYSSRGEPYTRRVRQFLYEGKETELRVHFASPCCKMILRSFVMKNNIRYDEVIASNDMMFSTKVGYYATRIDAVDKPVYVATVSKGSLTKRKTFDVIYCRYIVTLRKNQFLRQHGLKKYQSVVLMFIYDARHSGLKNIMKMLGVAIKYKQNIFIGCRHAINGMQKYRKSEKKDSRFIVK